MKYKKRNELASDTRQGGGGRRCVGHSLDGEKTAKLSKVFSGATGEASRARAVYKDSCFLFSFSPGRLQNDLKSDNKNIINVRNTLGNNVQQYGGSGKRWNKATDHRYLTRILLYPCPPPSSEISRFIPGSWSSFVYDTFISL